MAINLKRLAYDQIRADLRSGKLAAGSTLSAAGLAKQLGISHTPVREAISQLETEGFAEQVPRLGHQIVSVSRAELEELFELRVFLEQGAAAKAATRISPEAIEELWALCDHYLRLARRWRDTDDPPQRDDVLADMAQVDAAFHIRLLMAAGNRRLIKLVDDLQLMAYVFRRHVQMQRASAIRRWARAYREHCLIVRALEKQDGALAATTMKRHLEDAKEFYLGVYDSSRSAGLTDGDAASAWPSELLKSLDEAVPMQRSARRAARNRSRDDKSASL